MKELYDLMMEGYKSGNENLFEARARNWVVGADYACFDDEEANRLFEEARGHCALWRANIISSRNERVRMIRCIRQIAEKDLPNPYPEEVKEEVKEDVKEEVDIEEDPIEEKVIEAFADVGEAIVVPAKEIETAVKKTEEPTHVMGVVPEQKHFFGKRNRKR